MSARALGFPVVAEIVRVPASLIASPHPEMIADVFTTYQSDVAPYLRYKSNGTALVPQMQALTDASGNITGLVGAHGEPLTDLSTSLQCVATRTTLPSSRNTGIKQCMSRTVHYARDRITSLRLVIPNFYMNVGVETGPGAATSVTASIEYPAGTFTQVTFSGVATGSIADNNYLVSDACNVNIPQNAQFFSRIWRSNATAIIFTGSSYPAMTGDGFVSSGATTPDLTLSGSVTQATVNVFQPCAVIGYTGRRNVGLLGDSITFGTGETTTEAGGDVGYAARAVGPVAAYMNLAPAGDAASLFLTGSNSVLRQALFNAYCSDIILMLGTNDIAGARTSGQILADLATIVALFPTKRVWNCTVSPRTTSTDSWVTTGNQTAAATEAARVVVNSGIRAGIAGVFGVFDTADAQETSRNSGIFAIDTNSAAPATTADGVHPATKGHQAMSRNGMRPHVFLPHN